MIDGSKPVLSGQSHNKGHVYLNGAGREKVKDSHTISAIPHNEPTVILDLPKSGDYVIQYLILHEFGHILGLYHAHQHPKYLAAMKTYAKMDGRKVMIVTGLPSVKDRERLYFGEIYYSDSSYDCDSIMHFP